MVYSNLLRKETLESLRDASHTPFWLDDPSRPVPEPELKGRRKLDEIESTIKRLGIRLSRWSMDQADRNQSRENLRLRAMDWLGLGFDRESKRTQRLESLDFKSLETFDSRSISPSQTHTLNFRLSPF